MDRRKKLWVGICFAMVGLVILSQSLDGKDSKKGGNALVAKVDKSALTLEALDKQLENMRMPQMKSVTPDMKKDMVERWIESELLFQEAKKKGIDKKEDVLQRVEDMKKQVMIQALMQEKMKEIQVSAEEAEQYFNDHKKDFQIPEKAKLRHIQVAGEDEAKELIKRLGEGAKFEDLVVEKSQDVRTKGRGGDLGYMDRNQCKRRFDAAFETATFSMEAGGVSEPVKGKVGYHIIKLEEKQPAREEEFSNAKDRVEKMVLREKQMNEYKGFVESLKKKAKIERHLELLEEAKETSEVVK